MSEERIFCVGLYLTKGGESAIVDAVLSLWIDGYILAGRHGAKRWIKCRWYPDGRYREEDFSEGLDAVDGNHLDLGVHLKTENERLTARLDAAKAERDERRKMTTKMYGDLSLANQQLTERLAAAEAAARWLWPKVSDDAYDAAWEKWPWLDSESAKGGRDADSHRTDS